MQTTAAMFWIGVAGVVGTVKILRDRDMLFSTDADILKYEAVLFSDLYFPWQVLCEGTGGELDDTSFSAEGADFVSAIARCVMRSHSAFARAHSILIDNASFLAASTAFVSLTLATGSAKPPWYNTSEW